jgi:hypothetical protein
VPIANPARLMTATPTETDPKKSASAASPTAAERQLMAKREDLKLQRCTAPKRSEECGQKGGQQVPTRESQEKGQLPVYQSDPILRELQSTLRVIRWSKNLQNCGRYAMFREGHQRIGW